MELYLIRHADARPLGDDISADEERPLTETGEVQARALAGGLQRREVRLNLVLTSPLLRARQTAEGMLQRWSPPVPELQVCDELAPGSRPRKLTRVLRQLGPDSVGLVGHMPDLADYATWLIGSRKAQIDLAKAGVAHIICPSEPGKGRGTLVWLVTPEWMIE